MKILSREVDYLTESDLNPVREVSKTLINSGKWFYYKYQLYAVMKCFYLEDLLNEARVRSPTDLIEYMKANKIISGQAPVDYCLTEGLEFLPLRNDV